MDKVRFLNILEIICQQILAVFVLLVFWEVWKNIPLDTYRAWHILLSVSGIALYIAEGVQVYRKESIFFVGNPRENRVVPHGVLMTLGFVNLSIGIALKITQKGSAGEHFNSTHSILGLTAWIAMFVVLICGLITAKGNFTSGFKRTLKISHVLAGITMYLIGVIALGFGLNYLGLTLKGRNALIVLLAIYVTYSLKGPVTSLFYKMK